jgi:hypothetical protein
MAPELGPIRRTDGIAGQVQYSVAVTYPGEDTETLSFVGTAGSYGGPVVMITPAFGQMFVTDPARCGAFSPEWIKKFFGV